MSDLYLRTEALIGKESLVRLKGAHVAVFGLGGVGGYAVEALARAGVGRLTLVDGDDISESNLNRQIIALNSTVGQGKVEAFCERIKEINPECIVDARHLIFDEKTAQDFDFSTFSYVIDAIDTVSAKILLIKCAKDAGVPIVSCMGTGNRIRADFKIGDVSLTKGCALARVMRKELKSRGISGVDVLYSETPARSVVADDSHGRHAPASISYVPGIAGLMLAQHVITWLIEE